MKTQILSCARKRVLGLLSLCLVLTVTAWAQVQTGRIVGTVIDAQKAALPNATITVTEAATNQTVNQIRRRFKEFEILSTGDTKLQKALADFKVKLMEESRAKNATLQKA